MASGVGQLTGTLPQIQAGLTLLPGGESASNFGNRLAKTDEQAELSELNDVNRYEAGAGDGIDWWRVGGQAAATLPAGLIGKNPDGASR